ncbi:hypothetical protein GH810_09110 [Acetobacterium paludosum]|uniref:CvpA family protein n=1 Tax=Acetobacterium paludosum TaxID=52693 RepID=A0A923I3L8_9FIRM|nr:CvpA family protein [Acetobacterium paludosum]MBC3888465.1 hypothetical protein [Acetobacterium paludosum]
MSFAALTSLDLICILICIISGLIGYKRGAIKTLISFGGFIASFAIAWIFSPMLGNWLISLGIFNSLIQKINIEAVAQALIDVGQQSVQINDASTQAIINGGQSMLNQSLSAMTESLTHGIAQSISFLIIVFAVSIIVWMLQIVFKGVSKIPIIGGINRLLGLLIGLILAFCLIGVVLWVCTVLNVYTGGAANLPTYEESTLFQIGLPWIMNFVGIQ